MTPEDRKLLLATARATRALLTRARLHESWVSDNVLVEIDAAIVACESRDQEEMELARKFYRCWFGEEMSAGPPPDDNEAQAMIALARMAMEKRRR